MRTVGEAVRKARIRERPSEDSGRRRSKTTWVGRTSANRARAWAGSVATETWWPFALRVSTSGRRYGESLVLGGPSSLTTYFGLLAYFPHSWAFSISTLCNVLGQE